MCLDSCFYGGWVFSTPMYLWVIIYPIWRWSSEHIYFIHPLKILVSTFGWYFFFILETSFHYHFQTSIFILFVQCNLNCFYRELNRQITQKTFFFIIFQCFFGCILFFQVNTMNLFLVNEERKDFSLSAEQHQANDHKHTRQFFLVVTNREEIKYQKYLTIN